MNREAIKSLIDNNLPNNNEKAITPEMTREVLDALADNSVNPESDTLDGLEYKGGQTLEEKFDSFGGGILMHSKSSNINVRSQANGSNVSGDENATMVVPAGGNHQEELRIDVSFPTVGTTNYIPIIGWEANDTWHSNNAVIVAFGNISATGISVYLQRVYDSPQGKIHVTLLKA